MTTYQTDACGTVQHFTSEKDAVAHAKKAAEKCPGMKVRVLEITVLGHYVVPTHAIAEWVEG